MRGWSALLLLGGCAQIFGIDDTKAPADASRDTAPPPPDAPDCTGGDLATFDLGANDLGAEGTFVWDDGTILEYMNWNTGSPDSGGGTVDEDCVVIDVAAGGGWDDRPCSGAFAFVCERE